MNYYTGRLEQIRQATTSLHQADYITCVISSPCRCCLGFSCGFLDCSCNVDLSGSGGTFPAALDASVWKIDDGEVIGNQSDTVALLV